MKVSVLINNFNYGAFVDDCINSLLQQTYKDIEIIFYDDGSTDNSLQVVEKFKDRITIIANKNFGKKPGFNQANAINQAFEKSTGEIICLLDSDDFFTPDKIEKVVDVFKQDKEVVLVQHPVYLFIDNKIAGEQTFARNIDYRLLYKQKRWTGFYNPTSALSFSRSYLQKLLPLKVDKYWRVWPDVRLARVAPYFGKVALIEQPLSYYRRHNANDSSVMNKKTFTFLKNQIAHHEYVNRFLKEKKERKIHYYFSTRFIQFCLKCISFK